VITVSEAPDDLTRFCETEWSRLVGMLSLYTGDNDLAEDLAQQAIEQACKHWRRLRKLDAPSAWLHRVARNVAHSHYRRRGAAARAAARHGIPADEVGETAEVLATRAAVQALPMREREAIIWRFYLGCSVRETAAGLGCPEGTVKTLVYRAINRLREAGLVEEAFDG
jgi:RNA polymerase sigma factor (sigma-70 family)